MQFSNIKGGHQLLKKCITFKSVVVDDENGRRKSLKRTLHEHGRDFFNLNT